MIGVKLHPHWHGWPLTDAIPIAQRCEELGLPILIHLGFGARGAWRVLADAAPRLRLIFAHAGIPHYDRLWGAIRGWVQRLRAPARDIDRILGGNTLALLDR